MWVKASDWYGAWDRIVPRLQGDLLIGDLNIDPERQRRRVSAAVGGDARRRRQPTKAALARAEGVTRAAVTQALRRLKCGGSVLGRDDAG